MAVLPGPESPIRATATSDTDNAPSALPPPKFVLSARSAHAVAGAHSDSFEDVTTAGQRLPKAQVPPGLRNGNVQQPRRHQQDSAHCTLDETLGHAHGPGFHPGPASSSGPLGSTGPTQLTQIREMTGAPILLLPNSAGATASSAAAGHVAGTSVPAFYWGPLAANPANNHAYNPHGHSQGHSQTGFLELATPCDSEPVYEGTSGTLLKSALQDYLLPSGEVSREGLAPAAPNQPAATSLQARFEAAVQESTLVLEKERQVKAMRKRRRSSSVPPDLAG